LFPYSSLFRSSTEFILAESSSGFKVLSALEGLDSLTEDLPLVDKIFWRNSCPFGLLSELCLLLIKPSLFSYLKLPIVKILYVLLNIYSLIILGFKMKTLFTLRAYCKHLCAVLTWVYTKR